MYTLCPNCKHSQQISRKQLKKKQGQLSCTHCKQSFNGYLTLSKKPHQDQTLEILVPESQVTEALVPETQIPKIPAFKQADNHIIETTEVMHQPDTEVYAWQKGKPAPRSALWLMGLLLGLFILTYQVYYFKGYSFSQSSQIRPWLISLNALTNSPLPDYRKPQEFTTVGSSLAPSGNGHYRLQISLINHADFSQPPPYLQLTLQNFYGGVFAQRTFSPQEYLDKTSSHISIQRSATLDIDFLIAMPEEEVGGYSIALK